jgi:aminopeptidase-like protein
VECLEANETLTTTVLCEPQLGRRGLYPTVSTRESGKLVSRMMHVLAYSDGGHDLLAIADRIDAPLWELKETVDNLRQHGILVPAVVSST